MKFCSISPSIQTNHLQLKGWLLVIIERGFMTKPLWHSLLNLKALKTTVLAHALTLLPITAAILPLSNSHASELTQLATPFAVCEDGMQDEAACRKEIVRTQNLKIDPATETPEQLQKNALKRCNVFKNDAQALAACQDRVLGIDNTVNSGSSMQGGIIHRQTLPATLP